MPCSDPRPAYQRPEGGRLSFKFRPGLVTLVIPCGQCLSCRFAKAQEWGARATHEMLYHRENTAFTLTYKPEYYPPGKGLRHRDFQLFMKRLRTENKGLEIRYLMSGEYGTISSHPHYHAILFGLDFHDKIPWKRSPSKQLLYRSPTLERLWPYGHALISNANTAVAEYLAKYTAKRSCDVGADLTYERVDVSTGEIITVAPEYIRASNGGGLATGQKKGGLGQQYALDHLDQIYAFDNVVINKQPRRVPRYYDKILKRENPELHDSIKTARKDKAKQAFIDNPRDHSLQRREIIGKVKEIQYKYRHRGKFDEPV